MAGIKGKSGRKARYQEAGITALLDKCWPLEERQAVITSLSKAAKKGDVKAAGLLLSYAYGKPTEKHEHGGEGGGPIVLKVVYDSRT